MSLVAIVMGLAVRLSQWNIKDEIYTAQQRYFCSWPGCKQSIFPGMEWIYIWREHKDKKGHKATELAKAHAWHRIEKAPTERGFSVRK